MNNFIDLLHYASIRLKQGHYTAYSTTIMAPCPTTSFNLSEFANIKCTRTNLLLLETVDLFCALAKETWWLGAASRWTGLYGLIILIEFFPWLMDYVTSLYLIMLAKYQNIYYKKKKKSLIYLIFLKKIITLKLYPPKKKRVYLVEW